MKKKDILDFEQEEYFLIESEKDFELNEGKEIFKNLKEIFFDCEGVNLSKEGKLCILQIAVIFKKKIKIFIFDLIKGKEELIKILKPILEDKKILKIIHDVKRDSEALYYQFNIKLNEIFDTQLAYSEIFKKENSILPNFISLVELLKEYCEIDYSEKKKLPHVEMQDGSTWEKRPLEKTLLESSMKDVLYLIPLFNKLKIKLNEISTIEENLMSKIVVLSSLWSNSLIHHELEIKENKLTFIDEFYSNESKYSMRCFRSPSVDLIKVIIGAKYKNVPEYQLKFDSYFFSTGIREPKDMFFFMGETKNIQDFTDMIPEKHENYRILNSQIDFMFKKNFLKNLRIESNCSIGLFTNDIIDGKYNELKIFGKEKNIEFVKKSVKALLESKQKK